MHNSNENVRREIIRRSGVNPLKCMRCGKCTATCPAFDTMEYHPHQFVYFIETGRLDRLLKSTSIFKCLTCFACVERCPRQVEPAKLIEAVRLSVIREQGANHLVSDQIPELIDEEMPQQAIVSAFRKFTK